MVAVATQAASKQWKNETKKLERNRNYHRNRAPNNSQEGSSGHFLPRSSYCDASTFTRSGEAHQVRRRLKLTSLFFFWGVLSWAIRGVLVSIGLWHATQLLTNLKVGLCHKNQKKTPSVCITINLVHWVIWRHPFGTVNRWGLAVKVVVVERGTACTAVISDGRFVPWLEVLIHCHLRQRHY